MTDTKIFNKAKRILRQIKNKKGVKAYKKKERTLKRGLKRMGLQ